jgi:hypothetical protein
MTKKVISYKLEDGAVPPFVFDGGYFPNHLESVENPVLLGVSVDGAVLPESVTEYADELALIEYLNSYTENHKNIDPMSHEETTPWSQKDGAEFLFSKI